MDAHLLHLASRVLDSLVGSRISKIYQHDKDIFVFSLYGMGKKQYLTARTGKNAPFIFVSEHYNARGEVPPASVMRLRKYLVGKRIINMYCAWWQRTVYFEVSQENGSIWFKIDLKKGVDFCQDPRSIAVPAWVEIEKYEDIEKLLYPEDKLYSPYFTPSLRKTIEAILKETDKKEDAFLDIKSLLIDLESGDGDLFLYTNKDEKKELYAWQLPSLLKKDKEEEIFENPLYALNEYGKATLLNALADNSKKLVAKPFLARIKKIKALKQKLEGEEIRLKEMFDLAKLALLLQAHLYLFDKESKEEEIVIDEKLYKLNKRLTIRENMENLFHQSRRGKRGLLHLETRRQEVDDELELAKEQLRSALALATGPAKVSLTESAKLPKQTQEKKQVSRTKEKNLPKQVLLRTSVDGFAILLGKDTKGNKLALKLASPNDYWLHTADGASAHAIIKRDHAGILIPQTTLEEAGRMVAEKSPFKNDEKVLIQYAYAKNIQAMKNAAAGMVRIVKSEGSFWVSID